MSRGAQAIPKSLIKKILSILSKLYMAYALSDSSEAGGEHLRVINPGVWPAGKTRTLVGRASIGGCVS